jgi:hypothetical protein
MERKYSDITAATPLHAQLGHMANEMGRQAMCTRLPPRHAQCLAFACNVVLCIVFGSPAVGHCPPTRESCAARRSQLPLLCPMLYLRVLQLEPPKHQTTFCVDNTTIRDPGRHPRMHARCGERVQSDRSMSERRRRLVQMAKYCKGRLTYR